MKRIGLALSICCGCDLVVDGGCIDAPDFRAECIGEIEIPIVIHHPPASPCFACSYPSDAERVAFMIDRADAVLEPHGVRATLVEEVEENYLPIIADYSESCDAFHTWDDRAPQDGRLHVYVMHMIHRPGELFEGAHTNGVIAITPDAHDLILAHEIGHVLGLRHTTNSRDIMYPGDLADDLRFNDEQGSTMRGRACFRYGSE